MSTIDKASLIQIPSGYKNGKLYSVKPTPTYGSELVTNGDFSTDSNWTKGTGWTISGGTANFNGANGFSIYASQNYINGKTYKISYDVLNYVSGGVRISFDGQVSQTISSNSVNNTFYHKYNGGNTNIFIQSVGTSQLSIDNVSVKEVLKDGDFDFSRSSSATRVNSEGLIETASVLGSELVVNGDFASDTDWTKGTGVTISNGVATSDGSGSNYGNIVTQDTNVSFANKKVKINFDVLNYVSGKMRVSPGNSSVTSHVQANGSYEFIVDVGVGNDIIYFISYQVPFNGSIDNVSVKEVIENDVPRLDYSGGASCASLLLEPQRTNATTYSEDFSHSSYSKTNATVTSGFLAPDGSTNATKLVTSAANGQLLFNAGNGNISTKSISVFAKANTSTSKFKIIEQYYSGHQTLFDLNLGVVEFNNSAGSKIEDYGNGWYKCTHIQSYSSGQINATFAFRTNTAESLYIWGTQSEVGAYPTSYIPTSGSTVTRSADVCNNAGTSATFNSTEGVLFVEIAALANDGTYRMISLSDGTATNRISFFYQNSPSNTIAVESAGSGTNLGIYGQSLTITNSNKIAVKYKANDCALWVNGVEVATDTSFAAFSSGTFTELSFDRGDGLMDFYGKTKQLMVFDEALSDEELSDLTGQANLSFNNLATFYNYTIL